MAVMYNIFRNKMTEVMSLEVYILAIVWLLTILSYQYIMYTCTNL